MKRFIALLLILTLLLSTPALAYVYEYSYGYSQPAVANQRLSLRAEPTTHSTDLGSYDVTGEAVDIEGRYWDDEHDIWWVLCGFYYDGDYITGWTGKKRFDFTYDFYDIPLYIDSSDTNRFDNMSDSKSSFYFGDDDCDLDLDWGDNDDGCVFAYANQELHLREEPNNKTTDLGIYDIAGEEVVLTARHWDSVNEIWWVKCEFYQGKYVIRGWTGVKRFDVSTSELYELPER